MNNRTIYGIYGFLVGLGFPAGAFVLDVGVRGLPFTLSGFLDAHRVSPVYWVIDLAPVVLMFAFGLIGVREDRLKNMALDLGDRVEKATAGLSNDKKFFETLVDGNPLATVILDVEGKIIKINAAFEKLFLYTSEEVEGMELDPLITDEEARETAVNMTNRVLAGETLRSSYVRLRKDGLPIHVNLHAVPVVVGDDMVGALAIYEDVTERIHLQDQLIRLLEETDKLASTDPLTSLYNRRAISGLAEAEISRAQRESLPICLMVIDVDGFKFINDEHGHTAGDEAIRLVAKKIEGDKREDDILGRWGGDEFIVILPNTSPPDGERVGNRFCEVIRRAKLNLADGRAVELQLSVGVCGWEPESGLPVSSELLFHQADKALLAAKDQGRNRTVHLSLR